MENVLMMFITLYLGIYKPQGDETTRKTHLVASPPPMLEIEKEK